MVQAKVEPVAVDVSKKLIKFSFNDDNPDMFLQESINITNHGNAPAKIKWAYNTNGGLFVPSPLEDVIKP